MTVRHLEIKKFICLTGSLSVVERSVNKVKKKIESI